MLRSIVLAISSHLARILHATTDRLLVNIQPDVMHTVHEEPFSNNPPRRIAERYIQNSVCLASACIAALPSRGLPFVWPVREWALQLGYPASTKKSTGEFDHWFPHWMGGVDTQENIWFEPHAGKFASFAKDKVELLLWRKVCVSKTMTLDQAKSAYLKGWTKLLPQH